MTHPDVTVRHGVIFKLFVWTMMTTRGLGLTFLHKSQDKSQSLTLRTLGTVKSVKVNFFWPKIQAILQ